MSDDSSISEWIQRVKTGDPADADRLWQRYYKRLIGMARTRLRHHPKRTFDEEDVVVDAFDSFFRGAEAGRFPQLTDRDDLWQLLAKITEYKAANYVRDATRQKRGGGKVRGDSALWSAGQSDRPTSRPPILNAEPTPEFAVMLAETVGSLLHGFDNELQRITLMKLEGYTNREIADSVDRSLPTVERRLRLIRDKWKQVAEC